MHTYGSGESKLVRVIWVKSVVRWADRPAMTLAVDLVRKATKQTNISDWAYIQVKFYLCYKQTESFVQTVLFTCAYKVNDDKNHNFNDLETWWTTSETQGSSLTKIVRISHWDNSFEYPKISFGREIRKLVFWYALFT